MTCDCIATSHGHKPRQCGEKPQWQGGTCLDCRYHRIRTYP